MTIKEFADKFSAPQNIPVYVEVSDKRFFIGANYFCNNCLDFWELVRNQPQLAEREISQIMLLSDSVSIYYDGKPKTPDAFSTGGGYWCSVMYFDEDHYFCVCNEDEEIGLAVYDHREEDQDDGDFCLQGYERWISESEFTEEERKAYNDLASALAEAMGCEVGEWME